ncbi:hypothetical protein CYJ19_05935 [Winkia neuii]|uniref:HNH domain-containing protein n=1 Tax=Winkia neuii TaxID=33007 RepID=A0A2I1IMM4_9ACTO|nr:hypothetical protein CYJ19_05935 [Winkia neuii]
MAEAKRSSSRRFKKLYRQFKQACTQTNAPCWLCGQPIDYTAESTNQANGDRFQLDHFYPVSKRPDLAEDPANFRPAHADCNRLRGNGQPHPGIGITSREW